MNFTEAVQSVLRNYANINGRAPRSEYWFWILFIFIVGIIAGILDAVIFGAAAAEGGPIGLILNLALLIPGITVSVRRLHDVDRSGWWLFIILIPLIGFFVLLYWYCKKGTDGSNRFGNDPLLTIA